MNHPLLLISCALAMIASGLDFARYAIGQSGAADRIERHGLEERFAELGAEVGRRYDPIAAELRVALALLGTELDRRWLAELPEERRAAELERAPGRLAEAAQIGRTAWPRRPASWEAAMVLGGATYLQLYRSRDPRLMAEAELWEAPLEAAHRLAPAERGPVRFLAAARIGNWSSLTRDQRRATTELLERAFRDRTTFNLLIADWLRVAPSRSSALELVPARPWAWQTLEKIFSARGDLELMVDARGRWYETLATEADRALEDVRAQLAGGERRLARRRLLNLVREIPLERSFGTRLERLVELLPAGPVGSESAAIFRGWLDWTFELCLLGDCPFEPAVVARLARLSGDLAPHRRALAFLIAGDLPRAELLERRFALVPDGEWSGYFLLKAERLAERGEPDLARASLDLLPSAWRDRPRYWLAMERVAESEENRPASERASARLAALRRTSWEPSAWDRSREREPTLTLLPAATAEGLALTIESAAERGAVVEVSLDGELITIRRVTRARTTIELEHPVSARLHQLSVRIHAGGSVQPAAVRLLL